MAGHVNTTHSIGADDQSFLCFFANFGNSAVEVVVVTVVVELPNVVVEFVVWN
jgi:hypothetical protein